MGSKRRVPKLVYLATAFLILFTGAVVGIVVQPPLLRGFLELTGLEPGAVSRAPIALPVADVGISGEDAGQQPPTVRAVIALGTLVPEGDVVTVATPYGAGDARIDEVMVAIGQAVSRGDILARLDNARPLESAVASVRANLALREATLVQTRAAVKASRDEARAGLERAEAAAAVAASARTRTQDLFDRGVTTQALLDEAIARDEESMRDVAKAHVTLSRYDSADIDKQPDVLVAARNVDTARAELGRALQDMARSTVTAPLAGTVLDIHVAPGEKPGSTGVLDIGNIAQMTARLEVYQSEIARVGIGQSVELTSDVLPVPLTGLVSQIGYSIEPQTQISSDPAANTDARVIKVMVRLDEASSARAARLTHLEVTARIAVEEPEPGDASTEVDR